MMNTIYNFFSTEWAYALGWTLVHSISQFWDFDIHEKALRKMLIPDGYLSEDESVEIIEWDNDVLKINGVKIKDGDRKKYEELFKKRRNLKKIE